jgi:hypothetical protein
MRLRASLPMGSPRQRTVPLSSEATPTIARMAVVLPAPFGPRKPNTWPGGTVKLSPSSATTSPYVRRKPFSSSVPSPLLTLSARPGPGQGALAEKNRYHYDR